MQDHTERDNQNREFKLLDDANILLRTPRQHNMYSIDLNNIVPHRDLTCLVDKASADECLLWHRRLEFLENKAIEKIVSPNWLFDIDSLTKSMNYVPVDVGTISTNLSGTKDATSQEVKKDVSSLRYIALPNWAQDALLELSSRKPQDHYSTKVPDGSGNSNPTSSTSNPPADQMETLTVETLIPIVSAPVLTTYSTDSQEPLSDARLISKRVANQEETPSLDNILSLTNQFEDILRGTTNSDESNGEEVDISNMEIVITASPTPTLRIHKDHPKKTLIEAVRTMLAEAKLPVTFWAEAVNTACYVQNMVLVNKSHNNTPYELFNGKFEEKGMKEVYVMQPPGFHDPEFLAKVYKVENAMYGLHQAPRARYGTLSKYLLKNGFQRVTIDQTLFIRKQREDFILVQVYVDDIIFGSSNPQLCRDFEALMHDKFQMSAMGELNFFLGLQVLQKEDGIFLSQDKHQVTPKECHFHAVKRIFRYLKGHPKLGLWYPKESPFNLVSFSDSDYGGATQDRKSTTGGCQFLGRRLISCQCKKQTIVATSKTESEYVPAASCYGQVL
nr:putative ribonuclease H-like domain-containing protein [Tanacetum cinerariifolium]